MDTLTSLKEEFRANLEKYRNNENNVNKDRSQGKL